MHQNKYDHARDLHIYAFRVRAAAAAADRRGDHEAADKLRSRAHDYSTAALEKTLEIAKQIRGTMRA